jgi:hypothetical protein
VKDEPMEEQVFSTGSGSPRRPDTGETLEHISMAICLAFLDGHRSPSDILHTLRHEVDSAQLMTRVLQRMKEYDPCGCDGDWEMEALSLIALLSSSGVGIGEAKSHSKKSSRTIGDAGAKKTVRPWDLVMQSQEDRPIVLFRDLASIQACIEAFVIAQQGRAGSGGRGYAYGESPCCLIAFSIQKRSIHRKVLILISVF